MATNDFKAFATGTGANVMTQADYLALAALTTGFQSGVARSAQLNKVWRQSSIIAAMLGQFIVDFAALDALDNGDLATLESNFVKALSFSTGLVGSAQILSSQSWVAPANVYRVKARIWAGGGGGGGANASSSAACGSSGGGGGYLEGIVTVTPGSTYPVVVGTGGSGGANTGGTGGNGGASSFNGLSVGGGSGGVGAVNAIASTIASGGTASGGTLAVPGKNGGLSFPSGTGSVAAGGGGSFGTSGSPLSYATAGNAGYFPGGGGCAASALTTSSFNGGAGANGLVILEW